MAYRENADFPWKSPGENRRHVEILLSTNPEELTRDEVSNLKLSTLSKCLGWKLTSKEIIDAYLRWLEVQRTSPSNHTSGPPSWGTIQKQWVEALRGREFSEGEIIREVKHRQDRGHMPEGKAVMTEALIRKVFRDENGSKESWSEPQSGLNNMASDRNPRKRSASPWEQTSDYEQRHYENGSNKYAKYSYNSESRDMSYPSVSGSYLCKRCHVKGHLLQNCPTNLDPAWDTPAPADYICKICGKTGDHWYTLCPQNSHYNSLTQLRERTKARDEERLRQRDIAAAFGVPSRFKPQTQKVQRLKFEEDESMATDDTEMGTETRLPARDNHSFSTDFKKDLIDSYNPQQRGESQKLPAKQEFGSNSKMDLLSANNWNNLPRGVSQRYESTEMDSDSDMDSAEPRYSEMSRENERYSLGETQQDRYRSNNVQPGQFGKYSQLIRKGTLSTEIVNPRPRRPTALEMWDRDDEERAQRKLKAQMEAKQNGSQNPSQDEMFSDATDGHSIISPLDTSEPQVLRVIPLDLTTSDMDIRGLFEGYAITAVSVWRPSFVHGSSTISAFVSLLGSSREESLGCCEHLTGRIVRGQKVKVLSVNNKDTFRGSLAEFQGDVDGNEKWQENPRYIQYHDEHSQLLQHLRLTAAFKKANRSSVSQGLPFRSRLRSPAPSPSSFESDRKDRDESRELSETDFLMEDPL